MAGQSILLVEDSPDDAPRSADVLRSLGARVLLARDGEAALHSVFGPDGSGIPPGKTLPSLVVLDLRLPKVDGLTVLSRMKADPRTRDVPVVVFTASERADDRATALGMGAAAFVVKPFLHQDYVAVLLREATRWVSVGRKQAA